MGTEPGPVPCWTAMGFNPHHPHKRTPVDYVLVAAALVVCALLVAWAFLG